MVYRLDDYLKFRPRNQITIFNKFQNAPKNLHEMSLAELDNFAKNWDKNNISSIEIQKRVLIDYLVWLEEEGEKVNIEAVKAMTMPVSDECWFFSIKDVHSAWDNIFREIEREAIKNGTTANRIGRLVTYTAGILAYYGLTLQQILALTLSDVQPEGIAGYNLPLTKQDIDVLLEYKSISRLENNKRIVGYKYIRTCRVGEEPDELFLSRPLTKQKVSPELKSLKKALTPTNLFVQGLYGRIYSIDKSKGFPVQKKLSPDWFLAELKNLVESDSGVAKHKKWYLSYRDARMAAESEDAVPDFEPVVASAPEPTETLDADLVLKLIRRINSTLSDVDIVKDELNAIKKQLEDLIK